MDTTVTIGEFSRLSHLSAKALRHYHDVGLLTPERIDSSGYRRYDLTQVRQAQLIGRLRRLDMPVPDIKAVLAAPDQRSRDQAIADHLQRMEDALGRTAQVVASLRALLGPETVPLVVDHRTVPATSVLGIRARVRHADIDSWCAATFPALYVALAQTGIDPAGPGGAAYDNDFFEQDEGEVLAYVPVAAVRAPPTPADPPTSTSNTTSTTECTDSHATFQMLPGGRFAVALHPGPYSEIDRTYGALGSVVAARDTARPDPIREQYLIGPDHTSDPLQYRTEVCWPITAPASDQPITAPASDQPITTPTNSNSNKTPTTGAQDHGSHV